MFAGDMFNKWLDRKTAEVIKEMSAGKGLGQEALLLITVKTQTTHFENINKDLKELVVKAQEKQEKRLIQVEEEIAKTCKRIDQVNEQIQIIDQHLIENRNRFAISDKKFEKTLERLDKLMLWSGVIAILATVFLLGTMFALLK